MIISVRMMDNSEVTVSVNKATLYRSTDDTATVFIFLRYNVITKIKVKDGKTPKSFFFAVTLPHMVRFTSSTDHDIPVPGAVCLLCRALQIFCIVFHCIILIAAF